MRVSILLKGKMYRDPFYPDRPRTHNTLGNARIAFDVLDGKRVKGYGVNTKLTDTDRLRHKWPKEVHARQLRESLQQSITQRAHNAMLLSQLSQMPAYMRGAVHMLEHREYILKSLRVGTDDDVQPVQSDKTDTPSEPLDSDSDSLSHRMRDFQPMPSVFSNAIPGLSPRTEGAKAKAKKRWPHRALSR